jgi:3,4-dihydroxy 2-butanone 4-phosphate synthase/GTP cyclohydrolase II
MNDDGTMARRPDLEKFAQKHGLKIGTIADLIHYRTTNERTVEKADQGVIATEFGDFNYTTYRDTIQNVTHLALTKGDINTEDPTLVRVHIRGDVLRDLVGMTSEGDAKWTMHRAMERVAQEGKGVVLLLDNGQREDLGTALNRVMGKQPKTRAANFSSSGAYLTVGTGSQILRDLGVGKMRLLSSPIKFNAISGFDLEIVEYIPCDE